MSEDSSVFCEDVVDFCNALESACVKLRVQVEKLLSSKTEATWNAEAVKWERAVGSKGEFERSEDLGNIDFKAMLKDLQRHGGKLSCDGWFYWVYRNGSTVGRKSLEARQ